jgi:hypothetical protein
MSLAGPGWCVCALSLTPLLSANRTQILGTSPWLDPALRQVQAAPRGGVLRHEQHPFLHSTQAQLPTGSLPSVPCPAVASPLQATGVTEAAGQAADARWAGRALWDAPPAAHLAPSAPVTRNAFLMSLARRPDSSAAEHVDPHAHVPARATAEHGRLSRAEWELAQAGALGSGVGVICGKQASVHALASTSRCAMHCHLA